MGAFTHPTSEISVTFDGQVAEGVFAGLEALAVDVDVDGVGDGDGVVLGVVGAHDGAEAGVFADGDDDDVGVLRELEWDLLVELHGVVGEPLGGGFAGEVQRFLGLAVEEDLDAVDVEPVGALDPDLEGGLAG